MILVVTALYQSARPDIPEQSEEKFMLRKDLSYRFETWNDFGDLCDQFSDETMNHFMCHQS